MQSLHYFQSSLPSTMLPTKIDGKQSYQYLGIRKYQEKCTIEHGEHLCPLKLFITTLESHTNWWEMSDT